MCILVYFVSFNETYYGWMYHIFMLQIAMKYFSKILKEKKEHVCF